MWRMVNGQHDLREGSVKQNSEAKKQERRDGITPSL